MQSDLTEIKCEVKDIKRTVMDHDRDIAVLKDWRAQATPRIDAATGGVVDLRVQVAKMAALGGSAGMVFGVVFAILKALGVM